MYVAKKLLHLKNRQFQPQQHICRVRPNWRSELLATINDAINGLCPLQEIKVCCGGQARAKRAAEAISRPLERRKVVQNANSVDLESDDDEDTGDYMANIDMNGTWTVEDYHTGEVKESDKGTQHQTRWRMFAFVATILGALLCRMYHQHEIQLCRRFTMFVCHCTCK